MLFIVKNMEDHSDSDLLKWVLSEWLGEELATKYMGLPAVQRAINLRGLLFQGVAKKPGEGDEDSANGVTRDHGDSMRSYEDLWYEYCETYSLDPFKAAETTPFPFFVNSIEHMFKAKARMMLAGVEQNMIPNLKDEDRREVLGIYREVLGVKKGPVSVKESITAEEARANSEAIARMLSGS